MSDAAWKRAQTQPTEDEDDIHFRGKLRLRNVLQRCGYDACLEKRFSVRIIGYQKPVELRTDVYGCNSDRAICAECDGPGGHKTTQAANKDNSKLRLICEQYHIPKRDYFPFHYKRLIGRKAWTDEELANEMELAIVTYD